MADSATVERVDMNIGGDGGQQHAETDWGKMTPEQQSASVDEAYASVRERRAPEPIKETETTETSVDGDETPAVGDAARKPAEETVVEGEDEGEGQDWLDQEAQELATAYGLDDEFLAAIPSRDVLDRVFQAIDKKAFEAGKADPKAAAKPIQKKAAEQQQEKPASQAAAEGDPLAELDSFKLDEELGAEDAPKIAKAFAAVATELKQLRAWRDSTQQQSQQQAVSQIRRQALDSIHSLGNTELFGKPGERPTKEQAANIEKAIEAHFIHARGLIAAGRQAAPTPAFLKAAVHLAFGDQLSKQQQRQITDKLRKQSARRTGGSATKPLPKAPSADETPRQRAERLMSEGLGERYKELVEQA